ncbi:MAG: hypothetical protein IJQ85_05680 [Selenomonadaceae bacterium]|nr:hypothetical protein [Selenomonadaceae bacterium]
MHENFGQYYSKQEGTFHMSAMAWNLIKLDATKILCNLTKHDVKQEKSGNYKVEFKYDLSDKNPMGRDIISSEDTFADNALFFLLRKILKGNSKLEVDQSFMRSTLIFIDFKEVFSKYVKIWSSVEWPLNTPAKDDLLKEEALPYRMQLLFKDGLFLSFDGKNFKNFVPFDKSSSMARNCQITFIDSQTKKTLDERLMLDMNFIDKPLPLSKFYAYRGLYLSSASRIKIDSKFPLNEETVIVLKDCEKKISKFTFGASKLDKLWIYETKEKNLNLNLFDGEGLISPDFAEYISDFLRSNYNYPSPSHSFQIRMPFTKGVLHEVDFKKFFTENLPAQADEWFIKDVFGITRDLRKTKIILTKSMFKFAKWMKDYLPVPDPMKYFFEKFAEYDHALYVTNTEARLFNPGRVRLNHQFLSTLDLSDEDFESLVADHLKLIDSLPEKFAANSSLFSNDQDSADEIYDDSESDEIILHSSVARTACLKVLAKNPVFIRDPKVKNIYEGMKKSYECNLGLGRLEVEGEQRFLSCDLLFLLIEILKSVENVKLDDAKKKALYRDCLYQDRFFMPDRFFTPDNKRSIKPDKKYVFLRNPHLSRNEQVLLRAFVKSKSLHEKYFSHLKGVVMLSANSTAAMALGGADFDGDLVKVISDKRIVHAVEKGNVDKNLPPIEIPSTVSKTDKTPLQVIVDTFSNKVGLVSNWAVKLAKKEYSSEFVEEKYKDACAKCTIVVGLEIDAAKTGSHPEENIKEVKNLAEACGKSIFLESKKVIEKILQGHYSPRVESEKNSLLLYFSQKDNKSKLNVPIEEDNSILERLPARYLSYLKSLSEKSSVPKSKADSEQENSRYFDFETSDGSKTFDKDLSAKLATLVEAYLGVLSRASKAQRIERNMREKNFTGHVVNTLKLQYDDYRHQKLPSDIEIETALNQLYAELSLLLKTSAKVKEAIDGLKNKKWHLTCEENRPKVAAEILGLNLSDDEKLPPFFELLYNFRYNGYMLFYFILKNLESLLFDKADYISEANLDDSYSKFKKNRYYDELYQTYLNSITEKKSKRIWNAQLIKICRRHLQEIFGGDMSEALKYYWAQKSKDSGRNFLWNVFNEQEILSQIFIPKEQDE